MPKRIESLTPEQEARFEEWADRWIAVGLSTAPADRARFEEAARACYRFAGLAEPKTIVWCPSPLVVAFAGPIAASMLKSRAVRDAVDGAVDEAVDGAVDRAVDRAVSRAVDGAVRDAVDGAVDRAVDRAVGNAVNGAVDGAVDRAVDRAVSRAVDGAVREAVREAVGEAVDGAVGEAVGRAVREAVGGAVNGAVDDAVRGAVDRAVDEAVDRAVRGAVNGAVNGAVDGAVGEAVREAVGEAVDGAVGRAVREAVGGSWSRYMGGQFWVGGWWWGGAWTSFFREVCGLELPGDLWDRARAYEATMESACWWWPGRDFIMVSERPSLISREQVAPRGWGSHRLHREDGPAVAWDGWGVYAWHGLVVPADVIETPAEAITAERIRNERNAEVRRVLIERVGAERYLAMMGAQKVATDDWGALWRAEGDDPYMAVEVLNTTPEADGTHRRYLLGVPADDDLEPEGCLVCGTDIAKPPATPHQAIAWTFHLCERDYAPVAQA